MSKLDKWLNLKLDLLPCIAQEVEKICKDYQNLTENVRKGDNDSYQKLILLQTKIRARVEEFDRFYDRNYADHRIGYFEKMKLKLRKLLSPHVDVNKLIYEDALQQQQNKGSPSLIVQNTFQSNIQPNEPRVQGKPQIITKQYLDKSYEDKSIKSGNNYQELPGSNNNQRGNSKSPIKQNDKSNQQVKSVTQNGNGIATRTTPNSKTGYKPQSAIQNKTQKSNQKPQVPQKSTEEQKQEVVFTIKMSKEEYVQFLQAKQRAQQK